MKILFVAVFTTNSTNTYQSTGLKDLGHSVYEYDYRKMIGSCGGTTRRDNHLISLCNTYNPDFVLFSKCNQMHYRVIDECNKVTKTCLWYMDASHNFDEELIDKIKRCTVCISGVEGITPMMVEYNKRSYFVHQCPDSYVNKRLDNIKYEYDTSFIGDLKGGKIHSDRITYHNAVNFRHFSNVYGSNHNLIVNKTKINLNFTPTDSVGTSVRLYKLLSSGGFVMTTPWKDMEKTFTPNTHLVIFTNVNDLKEKVSYYLDHDNEREIIRNNGHLESEKYSPKKWGQNIILKIQ